MANYEEASVKLINTQLNKLKFAAKDKAGKTLRITKKNFLRQIIASWIIIDKKTKN